MPRKNTTTAKSPAGAQGKRGKRSSFSSTASTSKPAAKKRTPKPLEPKVRKGSNLRHLKGCPGSRVERYEATTPKGGKVMVTRCVDCGEQSLGGKQAALEEIEQEVDDGTEEIEEGSDAGDEELADE